MAFIGNTNTTQAFTPAVDYFSGNASTTAFTLSRPVASVAQVQVTIDNVAQNPSSAYTVSANTITFTSAPLSGTNNIYVYYTSPITQVIAPGQGTVTTMALDVYGGVGTSAMNLPAGTTAQRPSAPVAGAQRYNSTTGYPEWYSTTSSSWLQFNQGIPYTVTYLVVAGGGGAGEGGGGAGGFLTSTLSLSPSVSYTVTVGGGGTGSGTSFGTNGSNSVFSSITSTGGGATSASGGSGGGAGRGAGAGGSGTSGQGNTGGSGSNGVAPYPSGGGGGAGAVGGNGSSSVSGNGGTGSASSITGSSVTYAGGGGGSGYNPQGNTTAGTGGSGGGGNGVSSDTNGGNGTANLGGGGGGTASDWASSVGGNGGSGVVILSIPTASYSGATTGSPTVTTSGLNTILSYTASGTYTA